MNRLNSAGRRWILLSAGVGAITRAAAYLPWTSNVVSVTPARYSTIEDWLPPEAWSWVWLAVGLLLVMSVVWRAVTRAAMSLLTGMLTLWGASSVVAWVLNESSRSWVTGFFFLSAAVWAGVLTVALERREPRR